MGEAGRQRGGSTGHPLGDRPDIDAMLARGVAVLRASGRLRYEAERPDQALVLAILDAVFKSPDAAPDRR